MGRANARKLAIADYKLRTPARGAFAIRCTVSGRVWVGASQNLDATRNGTWFTLRHGQHRDPALQAAWNAHGEEAFRYDVLERLDDDVSPIGLTDLLKDSKARWAAELGATTLLP